MADGLWCVVISTVLLGCSGEINDCGSTFTINRNLHIDDSACIQCIGESTVFEDIQNPANGFFCIVLHMAHIGIDDINPEMCHHFTKLLNTRFVSSDLCRQICNILVDIPAGVLTTSQHLTGFLLAELTA